MRIGLLIGISLAGLIYAADWIGQNGYGQLFGGILLVVIGLVLAVDAVLEIKQRMNRRNR